MNINNQVTIIGTVDSEFEFCYEQKSVAFYKVFVKVCRRGENWDRIPVIVSENIVDVSDDKRNLNVTINGIFCSYNQRNNKEKKNKLMLFVYAKEWIVSNEEDLKKDNQMVLLEGFICKPVIYRKTPLGSKISDVILAVKRPSGVMDYIPCIFWGRDAELVSCCELYEYLQVWGRIQSREYKKNIGDGKIEGRIAYEFSVRKYEFV